MSRQISELPLEIRERIIREHPEMIPRLTQTARGFYEASNDPYLKEVCNRPITWDNLAKYLLTGPQSFAIYQEKHPDGFISDTEVVDSRIYHLSKRVKSLEEERIERLIHYDESTVYFNMNEVVTPERENFLGFVVEFQNLVEQYGTLVNFGFSIAESQGSSDLGEIDAHIEKILIEQGGIELDLLSRYRILSNRLGCISRKSDYAKDIILRKLDERYHDYQLKTNITAFFANWIYFYSQAYVFGIYPLPPVRELPDNWFTPDGVLISSRWSPEITSDINQMIDEIPIIYKKVRSAILKLD